MRQNLVRNLQQRQHGQTLLMFVLFMVVLFIFAGLGIDLGFAYITRARLSKAVDAACLAAVRNIGAGTISAGAIATNAFFANYGVSGRDVAPPVPVITYTTDLANNNIAVEVKASVTINTFFIRAMPAILPGAPDWKTLTVGSDAVATRKELIMTLVLDVSGSMDPKRAPKSLGGDGTGSGGGIYLPSAVEAFIGNFSDTIDKAAMVKFSTVQQNVFFAGTFPTNSQPTQPFRDAISNDVAAFTWNGATFSQGGLTNGLVMENNAPAATTNAIKAVVFFTDGLANTIQDTLSCPPATLANFGGQDATDYVCFYDPITGGNLGGGNNSCCTIDGSPSCCSGASQFKSSIDGSMKSFDRINVSTEAEYRAVQVANDMRANKTIVYSIGVGSGVNMTFLQQVANDPSAGLPGFKATSYDGQALVANNPADLGQVFQSVASQILMRLSR
ncbi:MAG: pilus assembly protein [Verrucomicrobiia bacterium]